MRRRGGSRGDKRQTFFCDGADAFSVGSRFDERLHVNKRAIAAGKCLSSVVEKVRRRYRRDELPLFAVLFHKIDGGGTRHMFERYFEARVRVEQARQDVGNEKALAVVRVFLLSRVIEMHFAVQE